MRPVRSFMSTGGTYLQQFRELGTHFYCHSVLTKKNLVQELAGIVTTHQSMYIFIFFH